MENLPRRACAAPWACASALGAQVIVAMAPSTLAASSGVGTSRLQRPSSMWPLLSIPLTYFFLPRVSNDLLSVTVRVSRQAAHLLVARKAQTNNDALRGNKPACFTDGRRGIHRIHRHRIHQNLPPSPKRSPKPPPKRSPKPPPSLPPPKRSPQPPLWKLLNRSWPCCAPAVRGSPTTCHPQRLASRSTCAAANRCRCSCTRCRWHRHSDCCRPAVPNVLDWSVLALYVVVCAVRP